jgi:hypothetical protein
MFPAPEFLDIAVNSALYISQVYIVILTFTAAQR